ncbi:MAG TPA: divalent-cation tolerance protein CutA [Thermoanaerobaculia bacterium]|nr:divalent-cation tolerance protein CutA [Thermoanaerobaculia bacterium]
MRAIVVVTTVGTEEQAYLIAREIVARRQAACVNILPGMRSIYRWKGKICKDGELLLLVKTLEGEFEAVAATIRELHSYELPEILSFDAARGEQGFLDWLAGSVDKNADFADEDDEDEIAYED